MGLISFLKDAGANILGSTPDASEIENYLRDEFGSRIVSLKAGLNESEVKLVGVCDTIDTREQVILVAGNIKGVEQVNDDNLRIQEEGEFFIKDDEPPPIEEMGLEPLVMQSELYTIQSGDTLSQIAKTHYGDAMKYKEVFEANRDVIKDPDKIYPGQVIRLP